MKKRAISYFPRTIFQMVGVAPALGDLLTLEETGREYVVRSVRPSKVKDTEPPFVERDGWEVELDEVYGVARGNSPHLKRLIES